MKIEEYRALIAKDMTEEEMIAAILTKAHDLGWLFHHDRPAPYRDKKTAEGKTRWATHYQGDGGFMDLFMWHPRTGRIAAFELKMEGEVPRDDQQLWLGAAAKAAAMAPELVASGVWYPTDVLDGTVDQILIWGRKGVAYGV